MTYFRFLRIGIVMCLFTLWSSSIAAASDETDIQAAITALLTSQGVQNPGVFADYQLIINLPYATVQAGLGTQGYGSENFALSKTSGTWKILLSGGGLISYSEFLWVGIPATNARNLQGFSCAPGLRRVGQVMPRLVVRKRVRPELLRAVLQKGPGLLPSRVVFIKYRGQIKRVKIIQPLDARECDI